MGIGLENIHLSNVTMLDPRAQLFHLHQEPRWFLNPEESQSTAMSYIDADQAMGLAPLGHGPTSMQQGAFTLTSTAGRSSDNRLTNTDNASPTPDGPGPDIGNEICQSPYPDSICSFATDIMFDDHRSPSMGTPNSFIGAFEPQTPDRSTFTPRERLYSTASSPYTYSPYTPMDDEGTMGLEPIQSAPPRMDRQQSIAMVEEVLGCNDNAYNQPVLEGLSQTTRSPLNEDSCFPSYPSPTFSAHFNASIANAHAITDSQTEDYFAGFSGTPEMPIEFVQCDGSPSGSNEAPPQSISRSNSSNCNGGETSTENGTTTTEESTPVVQTSDASVAPLTRASFIVPTSEFLSDAIPSHSLDVQEMMKDCYEALTNPQNSDLQTISAEAIAEPEEYVDTSSIPPVVKEEVVPAPTERPTKIAKRSRKAKPQKNLEFDAPSTSKQENLDSESERRERNNAACRQSRKRRKNKRMEMENMVERFTVENKELGEKIQNLEVECKKVRTAILSAMSGNVKREKRSKV